MRPLPPLRRALLGLARPVPPRARAFASSATGAAIGLIASVAKPVGVGYALTVAIALAAQRKLQYFPATDMPPHPRLYDATAYSDVEEHELVAPDGTRLHIWHWPAPESGAQPQAWRFMGDKMQAALLPLMRELRASHPGLRNLDVLQFHGNAGSRQHRLPFMHLLREGLGCSVTLLDYRGYGGSDGSPTERGLLQDGAAAYDWLRQRQQADTPPTGLRASSDQRRRPVLWGESIGSGVAVGLLTDAARLPTSKGSDSRAGGGGGGGTQAREEGKDTAVSIDGAILVLEAGFTSCVDLGASAYPWLPVRLGMLDRFESKARAAAMQRRGGRGVPLLSLHGTLDDIAPIALGRELFDALPSPRKRFVELDDTGHNDVPYRDPARYLREVAAFLSEEVSSTRTGEEGEGKGTCQES